MNFICPEPIIWNYLYKKLKAFQKRHNLDPPPIPLILNGWVFTSDLEKKIRWEETVRWADEHHCRFLIPKLNENEKYSIETVSIIENDPYGFNE